MPILSIDFENVQYGFDSFGRIKKSLNYVNKYIISIFYSTKFTD